MKNLIWLAKVLAVVGAVALALEARRTWREAKTTAVRSTVCSIHSAILRTTHRPPIKANGHWRTLNEHERRSIVSEIIDSSLDMGGSSVERNAVIVDPWRNPYEIAVRLTDQGEQEYDVWSNGPDGVSHTHDDIGCHGVGIHRERGYRQ